VAERQPLCEDAAGYGRDQLVEGPAARTDGGVGHARERREPEVEAPTVPVRPPSQAPRRTPIEEDLGDDARYPGARAFRQTSRRPGGRI
jgi:hypothetical protein